MKSITILALSALLCLPSITINAMDKGAESTALAAETKQPKVYKALTKMTVVNYTDVATNGPKVVSIDEVRKELQTQQERELSLIQKYPKTSLVGFGALCFVCGLYFPEIRESVTAKLSTSGTN